MMERQADRAVKTKLPPCCLRIINNEFVLVGTYNLDKETGNRTGSVDLYDKELQLIASHETYGAVLDLKLSPFDEQLVVAAHSTGNVTLWRIAMSDDLEKVSVIFVANLQAFETDTLITSLHFSPLDASILLVTNTAGESATLDIAKGNILFNCKTLENAYAKVENVSFEVQGRTQRAIMENPIAFTVSHSLECWTGEFGNLQPLQNVVFTGGDDATIMAHDLRSKELIWSNNRIHEAGVVGIKCSTPNFRNSSPTSIITGSYDDRIRLLELRMLGQESIYPGRNTPVTKVWDENLGGGVWRFAEQPQELSSLSNSDELLVCCMYNGAKIIAIQDSPQDNLFSETSFLKAGHESMCYGGDWCKDFAVTCSFYDNSLQRWNP